MTADRDHLLTGGDHAPFPGDRAAAEDRAAQHRQAALAALFEDAPIGFALFDTGLHYLMVNRALTEINGIPAQKHLGRHLTDVLPDLDPSLITAVQHVLDTGEQLHDFEVSGRTPGSQGFKSWLVDIFQTRGAAGELLGVAVVVADVSAQRRSERRLSQLLDSLFSFAGLLQPDGTLVEANRSVLEASGLTLTDVVGRPFWETPWWSWDPSVSKTIQRAVTQAQAGDSSRFDVDAMLADGVHTVDFQLVPVLEDGEVVALVPSGTDITGRRRSVEQATGVAALAQRLNAATTVEQVADAIRTHTPRAISCRHATLALLDRGTGRVLLRQSPDLPEEVAREFTELPLDSPIDVARSIRLGTTLVVRDPLGPDDFTGSRDELERLRAARAAAGVTVTATAPLFDSEGQAIGSIAVGWPHLHDADPEVLARLRTIAELCAQAIERAHLTDAYLVAAQRGQALAELAQALASTVTLTEVLQAATRLAPPVVGACHAAIGLLDPDGTAVELHFPDLPDGEHLAPRRVPMSVRGPQADAVHTGEPVLLTNAAEHERCYPRLSAGMGVGDLTAKAVLPLRDNADRVIGTLALGWTKPVTFDPLLRSALETIAEVCGQTLERARLHAAEHELVDGLQRRLLRPIPALPGLSTHAVYRAAQTAVGIGGDFHDGLLLPSGRLAVVLGDVAGHGMEAAADMAQLRTLLSTLLAAGVRLDDLFRQAEAALDQVATLTLATAVAAVVDPVGGTCEYVHAGHPPLVLRRPDGTTAPVSGGRGGLLGVGIADATARTVPFPPGSVLVGYTDGLVETRTATLDAGIATLVEAVRETTADPRLDAAGIAAAILDRCIGERPLDDDVALLVVSNRRD